MLVWRPFGVRARQDMHVTPAKPFPPLRSQGVEVTAMIGFTAPTRVMLNSGEDIQARQVQRRGNRSDPLKVEARYPVSKVRELRYDHEPKGCADLHHICDVDCRGVLQFHQ